MFQVITVIKKILLPQLNVYMIRFFLNKNEGVALRKLGHYFSRKNASATGPDRVYGYTFISHCETLQIVRDCKWYHLWLLIHFFYLYRLFEFSHWCWYFQLISLFFIICGFCADCLDERHVLLKTRQRDVPAYRS